MTEVIDQPHALRANCDAQRRQGHVVGFVPTMGALHAGHMSLVDAARARGADRIVVSIFVNPLQVGPNEDFAKYPRTFEHDLALCTERAVDLVYAPSAQAMYAPGFQTHVEVEQITQLLEGAARPTHFRGVTTVVSKLLNAVGPCIACFGRKDYQQLRVIERMVRDLDMPATIVGCPTAREADGLALSSRNRYLDPDQRRRAIGLYAGLCAANAAYRDGERSVSRLEALARAPVQERFDAVEYVTIVDAESLQRCGDRAEQRVVLLLAARLGTTRLIDTAILGDPLGNVS
jgi:pantoate--beta-alanine ligase